MFVEEIQQRLNRSVRDQNGIRCHVNKKLISTNIDANISPRNPIILLDRELVLLKIFGESIYFSRHLYWTVINEANSNVETLVVSPNRCMKMRNATLQTSQDATKSSIILFWLFDGVKVPFEMPSGVQPSFL